MARQKGNQQQAARFPRGAEDLAPNTPVGSTSRGEDRQLAIGRVGVALDQRAGRVAEPDNGVLLVAVIVERRGAAGRERGSRAGVPQERLVDVGAVDVAETGGSGRRAAGVVGDHLLPGMDVNHVIARLAPGHAPAQGVDRRLLRNLKLEPWKIPRMLHTTPEPHNRALAGESGG